MAADVNKHLERAKRFKESLALAETAWRMDPTRYELRAEYITRLVRAEQAVRAVEGRT